jgi:hypothetical protein
MLVKELMQRTGLPNFGLARMLIEDGLTEMAILDKCWEREETLSLFEDRRYYNLPSEAIQITDIIAYNHMNSKGQFRSIPRLLNEPKVKDVVDKVGSDTSSQSRSSDLNKTHSNIMVGTNVHYRHSKAMEYGYYYKGDRLAIVERNLYNDASADLINDTDAFQRTDYEWRTPSISVNGGIKIRYTYAPVYDHKSNLMQAGSGENPFVGYIYPSGILGTTADNLDAHNLFLGYQQPGVQTSDPDRDLAAMTEINWNNFTSPGKYLYLSEAGGFFTGIWETVRIGYDGSNNHGLFVRRPIFWRGGDLVDNLALRSALEPYLVEGFGHPNADTHIKSLYGEQEEYFIPISAYHARTLMCYIKGAVAEESGDLEKKLYYNKEFKRKLAESENAKVTGARMISPGPFAIRRNN